MTPTPELRFVEREIRVRNQQHPMLVSVDEKGQIVQWHEYITTTVHVLQQKWTDERYEDGDGEWRDVPVVKEQP